ncbi:related to dynein light-intermediate chain [Melanopsichium pennsylvanicum]|uniref:Related to dynein light-intermediate chain n=2 Tax=Melanopsichium pennsylvanicum TaxID=63383 RepID=A0AAJ4XQA0_9BASI|nr:related to dynein light-intermediate chain [Melanopsichium pennsylvanicum 4]SNX85946.1 related to dynein light-intermediate chain [Melanopsichium pennsylvanicum]
MAPPATPDKAQASLSSAFDHANSSIKTSPHTHANKATPTHSSQHDTPLHQDLWSNILNSVKSSKAILTKNIVLLGEPKSGKTSLLSALASTSPHGLITANSQYSLATSTPPTDDNSIASSSLNNTTLSNDLGLAYAYFDIGDENDKDEIVARVGAYTLHSSQHAYTSLLPFAFPEPNLSSTEQDTAAAMAALASATLSSTTTTTTSPNPSLSVSPKASIDSLKDTIIVILLDWEHPWTFLEHLRNWLSILHELVDRASDGALSSQQQRDTKWSRTRVALGEIQERLEAYIRAYVEPSQRIPDAGQTDGTRQPNGSASEPSPSGTHAFPAPITNVSVQLDGQESNPLADGTLTDNIGIPIVVVCTKADAIPRLERDKQFKEEQFDYIQQVLRTICMKYGAALFYTSSARTQSIDILRSYLLHRLFTPSNIQLQSQQQLNATNSSSNSAAAGGVTVFGFPYRASTTDRDTLLVPAGWDSWGKIKALREPFDCRSMAKAWDNDCEIDKLRRTRNLPKTKQVEDRLEKELQADRRSDASNDGSGGADEVQSAMNLYEDIVSDWEAAPVGKDTTSRVRIPDEQAFLGQHHAALQKDPDPRSKFSKRGVVGPMTGSSAGLPSVEKYMSRQVNADDVTPSKPERPRLEASTSSSSKRETNSAAAAAAVAAMTGGDNIKSSRPTSPAVSGTTSPGAPKQSEVLHSFFQSLLKDKGSGVGSPKADRLNRSNSSHTRRDPSVK